MSCKRCWLACAVEHSESKNLFTAMQEVPAPLSRVRLNVVEGATVPTECRHCDAAACVAACPTGALFKGGAGMPVLLLPQKCVGCRSCVVACPYGVVRWHEANDEIFKCDQCVRRQAQGLLPACVEACPTGCLTFRSDGDVTAKLKRLRPGQNLPRDATQEA